VPLESVSGLAHLSQSQVSLISLSLRSRSSLSVSGRYLQAPTIPLDMRKKRGSTPISKTQCIATLLSDHTEKVSKDVNCCLYRSILSSLGWTLASESLVELRKLCVLSEAKARTMPILTAGQHCQAPSQNSAQLRQPAAQAPQGSRPRGWPGGWREINGQQAFAALLRSGWSGIVFAFEDWCGFSQRMRPLVQAAARDSQVPGVIFRGSPFTIPSLQTFRNGQRVPNLTQNGFIPNPAAYDRFFERAEFALS